MNSYNHFPIHLNIKNHTAYSNNFNIRVVDLTQIHLATKEDKLYQLDYRASLFQSKTWEELRMIAKNAHLPQKLIEAGINPND